MSRRFWLQDCCTIKRYKDAFTLLNLSCIIYKQEAVIWAQQDGTEVALRSSRFLILMAINVSYNATISTEEVLL